MKKILTLVLSAFMLMSTLAIQAPASAAPAVGAVVVSAKAKAYKNCTAFNKKYPHGGGRKGAKDKTSGRKVTNFKVSNKIYKLYSTSKGNGIRDLDLDNDGIACEKK
jgi:hypothetical protein